MSIKQINNSNSVSNSNSKYTCNICNKQYLRKLSLDKHKILCEYKIKSKIEHQVEFEEIGDTPNHAQLVKIVQELTFKYTKMEEKLEQMQKWVDKKKKKLNIVNWLNTNIIPTVGFLEWINSTLNILPEHFERLMEHNLLKIIQEIFEYNLSKTDSFIYPIKCFNEKQHMFYICEKKEDGSPEWKQMMITDMALFLKKIQNKMIKELSKWKLANQSKIDDNDKISELFNKAVIKLMNISFSQDSTMSKIRNGLFNYLKTDLKGMIEYEFEF